MKQFWSHLARRLTFGLAIIMVITSWRPALAQSCSPVIIENKTSSTNWAKCGHLEFEESDPPKMRFYLISQAESGYDYAYSASGTNGGGWGNGCISQDGSWSVDESAQEVINVVTEYELLSCVYTSIYSGSLYLLQDHADGRETHCTPAGGSPCSYTYSYYFREDDASIALITYGGSPQWCFVGESYIVIDTDGNCSTPSDTTVELINPVSQYFPSTLIEQTPTYRAYEDVSGDVTFTRTEELQDEYTDGVLYGVIMSQMPSYPAQWASGASSAFSSINSTHVNGSLGKMKYRLGVPNSETNVTYRVSWDEVTSYPDGTSQVNFVSELVEGTGEEDPAYTTEHEVNPPSFYDDEGTISTTVENVFVTIEPDNDAPPGSGPGGVGSGPGGHGGCGGFCSSDSSSDGGWHGLGGFLAEFSMGRAAHGRSAGSLGIGLARPSASLATRTNLIYTTIRPDVEVVRTDNLLRQIKAPQALADIVVINSFKYEIRYYLPYQVGSPSGGIYSVSGSPFVTWTIENPDASTTVTNRIRITETRGANVKTNDYVYNLTNGTWTITRPGNLREDDINVALNGGNQTREVTATIRKPGGGDAFKFKRKYQRFPWGEGVVEEKLSPDSDPKTTTRTYYEWPNFTPGGSFIPVEKVIHPNGSWEYYSYDSIGRVTTLYSGFGNESPPSSGAPSEANCRSTWFYYDAGYVWGSGDNGTLEIYTPRLSIEYLQQMEVSRSYFVALSGERREIRCQRPYANWDDADNLVTITKYYTSGPNLHHVKSIEHPDGTMQILTNEFNAGGDIQTNIVYSGQPNGGKTAITDGTKTVTVTGSVGQLISRTVFDITSGITLSREIYSNYNEFNRPGRVTYLDGTYQDTQYACCGIDSTTDRDGVTTFYWEDELKRRTASTRLGITTTNLLDAAGNVLKTTRIGSNNWQIVVHRAGYNLAGEGTFVTNALNGVTSFTEGTNGSGELVKTNTYPNGSTRIETYYRDGSLQKLTGTAVLPVRYEYGVEYVDANYYAYTKEIKLAANGSDTSEWVKTYTDGLGRHFRTIHAAASEPYPASESHYSDVGQLEKTVDPDGVVTLYQYSAKGDLAYTAVDLDRDDTVDFNGTDRITFTTNWVEALNGTWSGIDARIRQSYAWNTNNSTVSNLLSTTYAATDGLRFWEVIQQTPIVYVTTASRTAYSGNNRSVTNTAPDNSYTISHYQNGRLLSVTRKDSDDNQISKTTYSYDGHGRQSTATDARNGRTTFGYNDADLVTAVTTPNPGTPGGAAQTTTTHYNTMLQATNVVQPDGASVFTEYHPSGELKKTWGSRTYPVEHTYDFAGRMKTMKTWQDFAGNSGTANTTWNYDLYRGWLTNKVYADGKGPIYSNTPAGRLALRIWARSTNTTYSYNNAGDLSGVNYSDSTPDVTYGYDRRGRQNSVAANGMTATLAYNDASQLLSETYSGGTLNGLAVTNAYDTYLRRAAIALNTQSATLTQFGYDQAGRLKGVTNGNYNAVYVYLANSPLVSTVTFKTNTTTRMTTTKSYDFLNRLISIATLDSGLKTLDSHSYAHNQANQRTRATLSDGSYWLYEYDSLGQVKSGKKYWTDGTLVAGQQFEYGFDDIGNRKNAKAGGDENGWNLRLAGYTNNTLNQITSRGVPGYVDIMGLSFATNSVTVNSQTAYRKGEYFRKELAVNNSSAPLWTNIIVAATGQTSVTGNVLLAKSAEAFTYDSDGNLTSDGLWTNIWNAENRLLKAESLSSVSAAGRAREEWAYLPDGRWIQRVVSTNNGSSYYPAFTNRYMWDGQVLLAVLDHTNGLVMSFMRGLDLSGSVRGAGGAGGVLAVNFKTNGTHFCAYDGNGNVATLVSATDGTESARYEYGPFAEPLRMTGPLAKLNPLRFSTQYADDVTGEVKYLFRDYNPSLGRWKSRDPIGERGALNLYGFVGNSSLNQIDKLGLDAAIINHGGYLGHTSFVIIESDGSVTAYHFYAKSHQTQKCCGLGSLLAVCCDKVSIWPEKANSLQDYIQAQEKLGGDVKIAAYAFGTSFDDQLSLDDLNEQAAADSGIYSLALGIECHKKSWEWFNEYLEGGQEIHPTPLPGQPYPPYWPQKWFETRRHRPQPLPQVPVPHAPAPAP